MSPILRQLHDAFFFGDTIAVVLRGCQFQLFGIAEHLGRHLGQHLVFGAPQDVIACRQ